MRYIFFLILGMFLVPTLVLAQPSLIVSDAVETAKSESGRVKFTYQIEEGSQLTIRTTCDTDADFFIEQTGAVISCGESYDIPNPGEGGRIEIIPYNIPADTTATHTLVRTKDGNQDTISESEILVESRAPQPLFTQVSVRQPDAKKPTIEIKWETLEEADISVYIGCESKNLSLMDRSGDSFVCNEEIAQWDNTDSASVTFDAQGYSTDEGLLFTFIAENGDVVGARKNISFTFETSTESETEADKNVIARLIAQVKSLLQVVAGLFN